MPQPNTCRFTPGGVVWRLTSEGISINGLPPKGTPGPPDTVRRVRAWFAAEIDHAVDVYQVPAPILLAILCNESAGGQSNRAAVCTARREEPGFISDDQTPARVSIGCCQTLLSTARAALRRPSLSAGDLQDPGTSLAAAAAYIASQLALTGFDPVLVAAAYNSGGLHLESIRTNRWGLRCFPLNTGAYIDRFVLWYNDAVAAAKLPVLPYA